MTDRYVVTGRANTTRSVYHTDEECPRIRDSTLRETSDREISAYGLVECTFCEGTHDGGHQGESEWHKLNWQLRNGELTE